MKVVVVGAGVLGLTSAHTLRARGHDVEVWTRDDSMQTVSAIAGAIWYPFLAEPRDRVLQWSRATFARLRELSGDPASGVSMRTVVEVFTTASPDLWWQSAVGAITAIEPPPGYAAAIELQVPVCDVPRHLPWLVRRVRDAGVRIVRRAIDSLDEALAGSDAVVNCTGLGARQLCGDDSVQPVRGQVVALARFDLERAWIDDSQARPFYAIPRHDEVVLGGTAQVGDHRLEVDDGDTRGILAMASAWRPELATVPVRQVRVGLRPYRPTVRLERELRPDGRCVVHNYGHGGSGYTLAWGCAEEVASLIGG